MKCALYARYSSENQREASIEDQFGNCETYAARQGWTTSHRYHDKAISGSTHERPGYQRMLKDAEAKLFDILLIDDLSRLSRDQVEIELVRRRMIHWGVRVIAISDGIDSADKCSKMLTSVKGIINDIYTDDFREKTSRGMVGQADGGRCSNHRRGHEDSQY